MWRRGIRWGWGLLLAVSVLFNLLAMIALSSDLYVARGVIAIRDGKPDEAVVQYQKALKLQPDSWRAHVSLGTALLQQDKATEAIAHLEQALRLKPDLPGGHDNLGMALCQVGRFPEAISHLEEALRLKSNVVATHNNLASALFQLGRVPEAIGQYEEALRLRPEDAEVHNNLGTVLFLQGKVPAAVVHYRKAVELDPRLVLALNNLALILATETNGAIRNVEEAVRCAERACELTTNSEAIYLSTLGMAYSEAGRFVQAVQASERGAALARAAANKELEAIIESRLKHYREGRPYHAISKGTGP